MTVIGGNFNSVVGARLFSEVSVKMQRAMEHLATGKKINRASDDVAGSIAAASMHIDQTKLQATIKSDERELKRLGTIDGAAGGISEMIIKLQGLVTTAANTAGMSEEERKGLDIEADSIIKAINHEADTFTFGIGQDKQFVIQGLSAGKLGHTDQYSLQDLASGRGANLLNGDMGQAQKIIDQALNDVSTFQAGIGSSTNAIESRVRTNLTALEQNQSAISLVEDADIAEETSKMVRLQVLRQATAYAMKMFQQTDADSLLHLLK